jgi:hypothetical protein
MRATPGSRCRRPHAVADHREPGPYDKIVVTAAAELVPPDLIQQLRSSTVVERDFAGRTHLRKIMPSASVCLRRCDNRRSRDGPAALSLPSRLLSIGMVES